MVGPLQAALWSLKPDLVAVSGDLTQRARRSEFEQARAFLDSLPRPQIVVPGNHDIPMDNVMVRFLLPLAAYRRHITRDLAPFYTDEEIAVAGVNTARSLTIKSGRINQRQVTGVYNRLCVLSPRVTRIIVTHHPFEIPEGYHEGWLVGRAHMAMQQLAACGADVFLAGHLHVSFTGHTAARYQICGHSALVVQAGTAISTRGRGEWNSFNVLRIEHPVIHVEQFAWRERNSAFAPVNREQFRHTPEGWVPA